MRVTATIGENGQIKREVDFEGALLPDGQSIEAILNENDSLKNQVIFLKNEIKDTASILTFIHNRKLRVAIEIFLILSTLFGSIILFF